MLKLAIILSQVWFTSKSDKILIDSCPYTPQPLHARPSEPTCPLTPSEPRTIGWEEAHDEKSHLAGEPSGSAVPIAFVRPVDGLERVLKYRYDFARTDAGARVVDKAPMLESVRSILVSANDNPWINLFVTDRIKGLVHDGSLQCSGVGRYRSARADLN